MDEIEVPSFFLCPISLEIMKDPVTITTGITYDRESIEKWLFVAKNNTCPVTKQVLTDHSDYLTPNITLRRLIQSWCALNASYGVERFPTPRAPVSKAQIAKIFNEFRRSPHMQIKSLEKLKSIASTNETSRRSMEAAGAAEFLATIISNFEESEEVITTKASDEALNILYNLQLSETSLQSLSRNGKFIESLIRVMQRGTYESRAYAVMLLKSVFDVADSLQLINLRREFFVELVQILRDQISQKASKSALKLLISVCPSGRNRIKVVEAGGVAILINLLLDSSSEKRTSEMLLMVLDLLCQCAEGRAELLKHGAGLGMVSKKILRVSSVATERGVKILHSIGKFSATPFVLQEMLSLGVVSKLCLVIQVDCGNKTKERAREILKLHGRAWRNSSCIPMNLLTSYPC